MAKWKRLTGIDSKMVWVNMDEIVAMNMGEKGTTLKAGPQIVTVRETPDQIFAVPSIQDK